MTRASATPQKIKASAFVDQNQPSLAIDGGSHKSKTSARSYYITPGHAQLLDTPPAARNKAAAKFNKQPNAVFIKANAQPTTATPKQSAEELVMQYFRQTPEEKSQRLAAYEEQARRKKVRAATPLSVSTLLAFPQTLRENFSRVERQSRLRPCQTGIAPAIRIVSTSSRPSGRKLAK